MRKASSYNLSFGFLLRFIPLMAGILLCTASKAQNFNYTFVKDSVVWQELNSQTILNTNNSAWNFSYKIPIGFSFEYLGNEFDSLTIETNGYLVFDQDRNYALTAFLGFGDCVDATGNHSVLGYALSGTVGNRILKIQYKNTSISSNSTQFFTYQVWLKESGAAEIHIGPNDFQPALVITNNVIDSLTTQSDTTYINPDSTQAYRIGLINMNMNSETRGLFIGGTTAAPQSQPVNDANPDPFYLVRAPSQGTRYTFTPNSN